MNKYFIYIIGFAFLSLVVTSCSKDNALEDPFIDESGENYPDGTIAPNPYWGWVQAFPGFVSIEEPRIETSVSVSYTNNGEEYWLSTGLYIPPGEEVTITIPAGMSSLNYRIGGFNDVLESSSKRYHDMDINGQFQTGENLVFSYFGGHLYLYTNGMSIQGQIEVKGAVKSPDFVLGTTNAQQWKEDIKNSSVPWTEVITENIILTLPTDLMKEVEDIESFASFYNDFIKTDFNSFYSTENKSPLRLRLDPDITASVLGSDIGGEYPLLISTSLDSLVVGLPLFNTMDNTYTLAQVFNLVYSVERYTNNMLLDPFSRLPYYRLYHRNGLIPEYGNDFTTAMGYMGNADLSKRINELTEVQRSVIFIQLAQEYGWNIYGHIVKNMRQEAEPTDEQHVMDAIAMYATEYANVNLNPFFQAWGFVLSNYATNYMSQYPTISNEFWKTYNDKIGGFDNKTAVVHAKGPRPDFINADRSDWVVTSFANVGGEQKENVQGGAFENMFDGDPSTFWHSLWESASGRYPHVLDIDMNEEVSFNYIYFSQRIVVNNQNNKCRRFQLLIKDDQGEWVNTEEEVYYMSRGIDLQRIYFKQTYRSQYIRLILLSPHPNIGDPINEADGQFVSVSIPEFGVGLMQ